VPSKTYWNNRFEKKIIPRRAFELHFIGISKISELFQKILHYTIISTGVIVIAGYSIIWCWPIRSSAFLSLLLIIR